MKHKHSVLFVDDQRDTLLLIHDIFKNEDFNIFFALSGQEALQILELGFIDVIVTDICMPNMTGFELLSIVKEKYPNIIRIILSNSLYTSFMLEATTKGDIFKYIKKPVKVNSTYKNIIREALYYSDYLKASS